MTATGVTLDQTIRLKFLAIDEATRATLRECPPTLDKNIDPILETIYHNIARFDTVASLYGRMGDTKTICQGQRRHFIDFLFAGEFDDEYFGNVIRVAQARERIGLAPRWSLGSYRLMTGFRVMPGSARARKLFHHPEP